VGDDCSTINEIDEAIIAETRVLALDILDKIGSGHPGATLSLMPLVYLLYSKVMLHDPSNPQWPCRDKLILSCGHLSLAQYIQLHYSGYKISLEDLKSFRTIGSITPGHPEFGKTPGIEATTGPLGQGFATAVGIALSDAIHEKNSDIHDCSRQKQVFVIASDGDIHEGITYEAANLASLYDLRNLTIIYDSNGITIDGPTSFNSVIDVESYFRSMNWHVQKVSKGKNGDLNSTAVLEAIKNAKTSERPSLIILETIIGWPAPNWQNSAKIHGNVLSAEELALTKLALRADPTEKYYINMNRLELNVTSIKLRADSHQCKTRIMNQIEFPVVQLQKSITDVEFPELISTRKANAQIIDTLQKDYQWVIGGSADLTESNSLSLDNTFKSGTTTDSKSGSNLIFGVREHAMSAISNGIATNLKNLVFCATYLVFSDYQKPSIRLSALMDIPTIFFWTHDSVAIGADGPTHQPIDQLAMLRAIPNFAVIRPSSANELKVIWKKILKDRKPVGLVLSRQDLPNLELTNSSIENVTKGGYSVFENLPFETPDLVLIATGSEVSVAIEASKELAKEEIRTRVVSMLSFEWFRMQSPDYQLSILGPESLPKISLEAGSTFGWSEFTGRTGISIGIDSFGESGDGSELLKKFGISAGNVLEKSLSLIAQFAKGNPE
jgi:transketolase